MTISDVQPTDEEVVERFESGKVSADAFHHSDHVRLAFAYLSQYAVPEALARFSTALRRFAADHGKTERYHETITFAYFFLIRERMVRTAASPNWEEFAEHNPDLLSWKNGILEHYYHQSTLKSELAKRVFILPDRLLRDRIPTDRIPDRVLGDGVLSDRFPDDPIQR